MSYVLLLFFFWLMFIGHSAQAGIPAQRVFRRSAGFCRVGLILVYLLRFRGELRKLRHHLRQPCRFGHFNGMVYACMFILLIGGEIAMWLQHSGINRDVSDLKTERRRRKLISEKGNDANGKTTDKK